MSKKSKDEMLPGVNGVQVDLDDKDVPTYCLVGLLTDGGVKSFALSPDGARVFVKALQTFIDRVDNTKPWPAPTTPAN